MDALVVVSLVRLNAASVRVQGGTGRPAAGRHLPLRESEAFLLHGVLQSCTPRWKLCVSDTDSALGFAVGAMFVKDTFAEDSKAVVSGGRCAGADVRGQLCGAMRAC